ncbi:synaptic vesicle glycoprotein 2C isoform X3 [Hemitrygon akajei]|uniref:synaptic vesicle glycoprotein 2C isoform X3 n=1 Tax=Hemitrygon akajei TaxID=2704970 RepID=UPI003BFA3723
MRGRMSFRDREPLLELGDVEDPVRGTIFEQQGSEMSVLQENDEIALTYEEAVKETGFGMFHMLLLIICGWANASDAVEILCVSFLLPTARCDLHLNTADMGWLTASIFLGLAWLVIPRTSLSFQLGSLHIQSWRIFVMLCSLPSLTSALLYALGMPESPKYLMETGQEEEALRVFRWMFRWNHREPAHSFSVHRLLIPAVEKSTSRFYSGRPDWLRHQLLKGVDPICKLFSQRHRSTSIALSIIFFSISFGFYGLWMWFPELLKQIEVTGGSACSSNWSSQRGKGVENITCYPVKTAVYTEGFILAAANLPGNIFSILMMDLLGGKLLLCASLFLSGLSVFFIWEVKTKSQSLIMSCLFSAISVIAWNSLDVIGLELYPTHLRSSAFGVFSGISRIASILGNVAFGQLVEVNCTVPILLVALMLFIGSLAGLKLPHIKNRELS